MHTNTRRAAGRSPSGPRTRRPAGRVCLTVQDTGIGISPDEQPYIFQKFFRARDERARESPGTGLGLSITRYLVELQGGRIWFESTFRHGTALHFTIPAVAR